MTENLAIPYAESRRQQLGATGYDIDYQHYTLKRGQQLQRHGQGQMWVVVAADPGILVSSDTGQYNTKSQSLQSHQHEHSGAILIQNNALSRLEVRFVVFTWRYPAVLPPNSAVPKPA